MNGRRLKGKMLVFILSFVIGAGGYILLRHSYASMDSPPLSWSEIWDIRWMIIVMGVAIGLESVYLYSDYHNNNKE